MVKLWLLSNRQSVRGWKGERKRKQPGARQAGRRRKPEPWKTRPDKKGLSQKFNLRWLSLSKSSMTWGKRIIIYSLLKMAYSRENVLSKPHASMLHAFCACNYIRLPLSRQHKTSVFASRFTPLRHFSIQNQL